MGSISQFQYQQMLSRLGKTELPPAASILKAPDAVEEEEDLHYQIIDLCRSRGWAYIHGSMAHKSRITEGAPDFVILADNGRAFFLEAKDKDGKVSTKQQAWHAQAKHNGHVVHVVRSLQQVLEIVDGQGKLI